MWSIEFYTDDKGKCPAKDYIMGLQVADRVKITHALRLLEEFGTLLRQPHTDYIGNDLWELRTGANRLFYFLYTGKTFVILHGYYKKTQKAPQKEIDTARRRRDDYVGR